MKSCIKHVTWSDPTHNSLSWVYTPDSTAVRLAIHNSKYLYNICPWSADLAFSNTSALKFALHRSCPKKPEFPTNLFYGFSGTLGLWAWWVKPDVLGFVQQLMFICNTLYLHKQVTWLTSATLPGTALPTSFSIISLLWVCVIHHGPNGPLCRLLCSYNPSHFLSGSAWLIYLHIGVICAKENW